MNYAQRRKEQAQKTETAILNAALELMREDGFDAVTVRDICKCAGITTGAFYHHFQSKEDLFDKGFAPLDQFVLAALVQDPCEDPVQRLKTVLRSYALFMEECGELAAQYYQRRLSGPEMQSMDATRNILRLMVDCFREMQEKGNQVLRDDPQWTAEFFYCHFRGTVIDWLISRRSYSLLNKMMDDFSLFELAFYMKK